MTNCAQSKIFSFSSVLSAPLVAVILWFAAAVPQVYAAGANIPAIGCIEASHSQHHMHDVVDSLLKRLKAAEDAETAAILEEAVLQAWIDSGSDTIDLLMKRTLVAMQDGDLPLALDFLNAIVGLAPSYAEGWNKRATVLYLLDDYNHSLQDVHCTLALEPRHFGALSGLGMIMMDIGNKQGALEAFRRALAVNPFLTNAKRAVDRLALEVEGREI